MKERRVLRIGFEKAFGTAKNAARNLNYSNEMLSKVFAGERNLAPDVMPKAAKAHLLIGLAIAQETTGYGCFSYIDGDRHPQTMIRRVEKEDFEADRALKELPWLLIDKNAPEDLQGEERAKVFEGCLEVFDRIQADFNFIVEADDKFQLGLIDYATKRERPLQAAR
ncbi:MAG: hypothetical protein ABFD08_05985 [Syntrophomonas sp.]